MIKQNKTYISIIRLFMVLIAVVCVVFSSCIVKSSVKSALLGQTTKKQQQKGVHTFINYGSASCELSDSTKDSSPYHISKSLNFNPSQVALFSSLIKILFSPSFKEKAVPAYYSSSSKISQSLPIFIHCRKLII